ncbi:hypothetical protein JCM10295v2_000552 [Rhodotorula toruloides]
MADRDQTPLPEALYGALTQQPVASTSTVVHDSDSKGDAALEASHLDAELPDELVYKLVLNFRGNKQEVKVVESDTVGDLKQLLWSLTSVPPERQKLVGLTKGKLPGDEEAVVKLGLGAGATMGNLKEFMMIGTPEGEEAKAIGPSEREDGDMDYSTEASKIKAYMAVQSVRNRRKLKEAAEKLEINLIAPPRPGKKLLVLDLDGCILDTTCWKHQEFGTELFQRPYLHEFLRAVSPHYDLIVWSQTHWRWLETKIVELNMIGPSKKGDYHLVTTLDRSPMFSIYSEREGTAWKHEVKALGLIWAKFPGQYTAENTIHVDDLSRNFALQPKNGLKVHAYKDALTKDRVDTDKELLYVARYLLQLTLISDFQTLDHSRFRKSRLPLPNGVADPLRLVRGEEEN